MFQWPDMRNTILLFIATALLTCSALSNNTSQLQIHPTGTAAVRSSNETSALETQQLVSGLGLNILALQGQITVISMLQSLNQAELAPNSTLFQAAKVGERIRS